LRLSGISKSHSARIRSGTTFHFKYCEKRAVVESEIKLHSSNLQSKKIYQKTKYPEVNQVVLEFFKKCSDKNIPISGPLLQAKAKLVAERLGFSEFQASNGWLESFHQRNCINNKILSGEAADANVGLADQWKSQIPDITGVQCDSNLGTGGGGGGWGCDTKVIPISDFLSPDLIYRTDAIRSVRVYCII